MSRIEELLEQLVEQNAEILNRLDDLVLGVKDINEELNWLAETSFAKRVSDGLDSIEAAIDRIDS